MTIHLLEIKFLFNPIIIAIMLSIMILSLNLTTSTTATATVATSTSTFEIFTKDSSPYGTSYSEWVEKWWNWWAGIPIDKHPVKDYSDPTRCSVMQNGSVWFLPDIIPGQDKINYECNVPLGKAILLPITTTICEKAPKGTCGSMLSDKELEVSADNILTPINNMEVIVDGVKVDLRGQLVKTDFFNLTFPENPIDIWGTIEPGTYRAIATGYFLFLHDLTPGTHEIELRVVDLLKGNEGPPPKFDPMREGHFKIFVS